MRRIRAIATLLAACGLPIACARSCGGSGPGGGAGAPPAHEALAPTSHGDARRALSAPPAAWETIEPQPIVGPAAQLAAGTLRVRVIDAAGAPLPESNVYLVDVEADERATPTRSTARLDVPLDRRKSGKSDADGVFLLTELGPGPWRVWAGKPGWLYVHTAAFTLDASGPGLALELSTRPVPAEQTIRGTVFDPIGKPTFASVLFVWKEGDALQQRSARVDRASGRFEVYVDEPGLSGALVVTTYQDRFGSRVLEPVVAGSEEVAVRLWTARSFDLDAREPDGARVEIGSATFSRRVLGSWLRESPGPQKERGRPLRWAVPDVPFRVAAQQVGYEWGESIVEDPVQVRDTLTIELVPMARVAGVVVAEGRPVGGASVRLEYADPRPQPADVELEDLRPRIWALGWARTDALGAFSFPTKVAGEVRLTAVHEDHGEGSRNVSVDSERGASGVVLDLDRPLGTIEGRVTPPVGHATSELLLRCEGPGAEFFLSPDDTGWFRARGLAAGTWRIVAEPNRSGAAGRGPEVKMGFPSHSWHEPTDWIGLDAAVLVELTAGGEEHVELDLTAPIPCTIRGMLLVDGAPFAVQDESDGLGYFPNENRHAFLERSVAGRLGDPCEAACALFDERGAFHLGAREPGAYRLRLTLRSKDRSAWTILDRLTLDEGELPWTLELRTGSVRITTADPELRKLLGQWLEYRWRGPGEVRVFRGLSAREEDGAFLLAGLPAGRGELIRDLSDERRVLATLDVRSGETLAVDLP